MMIHLSTAMKFPLWVQQNYDVASEILETEEGCNSEGFSGLMFIWTFFIVLVCHLWDILKGTNTGIIHYWLTYFCDETFWKMCSFD